MVNFDRLWKESKQHASSAKQRAEWTVYKALESKDERNERNEKRMQDEPGYVAVVHPMPDQIKPYTSFNDKDEDLYVFGIFFDYPTPYMKVLRESDPDFVDYYSIPRAMAYYASWHAGYTKEGEREAIKFGREELAADIKKLLGL